MPTHVIKSPLPGLVARVRVKEGQRISDGEEVVVLNVMKTEVSVNADAPGIVRKVYVKEWDEVDLETPLVELEIEQR